MIPIKLIVSGFLSYLDPVEIDFTSFDLACISGSNGAGKSSLLDAITWSLFGQARKRDDALVNTNSQCDAAEVVFIFAYEGNLYRVRRALPRGKTSVLEFNIFSDNEDGSRKNLEVKADEFHLATPGSWKALTAHTQRETQELIKSTLRMDYDTFINASFYCKRLINLQLPPGERKRY
jgi:exonuclease SbcC